MALNHQRFSSLKFAWIMERNAELTGTKPVEGFHDQTNWSFESERAILLVRSDNTKESHSIEIIPVSFKWLESNQYVVPAVTKGRAA
jgi:hypothetical protein